MAGMTLKAEMLALDSERARQVIRLFLIEHMHIAVAVFLRSALARIPVRTGFLKGAFRDLTQAFDVNDQQRTTGGTFDLETARPIGIHNLATGEKIGSHTETIEGKHLLPTTLRQFFRTPGVRKLFNEKEAAEIAKNPAAHARRLAKVKKNLTGRVTYAQFKALPKSARGPGPHEFYYDGKNKILKTPTAGVPYVTRPKDVLTVTGLKVLFNLQVRISYFRVMDFYGHRGNGPWGAMEAGEAAMIAYLQSQANKLPLLESMMGQITLLLRGNGVTKSTQEDVFANKTFKIQSETLPAGQVNQLIDFRKRFIDAVQYARNKREAQRERLMHMHAKKVAQAKAKKNK